MDKQHFEISMEAGPGPEFFVKVDAQVVADPSFMKDKVKAIFFWSWS